MSNVMSGVKNMRHPERGKLKIKGDVATFWFDGVTAVYGVSELQEDFNRFGADGFYKKYGFEWRK